MSKPRYRWWGFARRMIRDYPAIKKEWRELHRQSISADISGMPRGSGASRTVETITLRQLPIDDQKVYDAVTAAIEITAFRPNGEERLRLIEMMYWSPRNITAKAAAPQLFVSKRTAERWHGDFVRLVGMCYGFEVGVPKPK